MSNNKKLIFLAERTLSEYVILGSMVLYLPGYLSLRFKLTAFGIDTDLSLIDESYLFEGAKFTVFLISTVPSIILIILFLFLLFLPYRLLPLRLKERINTFLFTQLKKIWKWLSCPYRLVLLGIIFTVVIIQFVMRQVFFFNNLLLASHLPDPQWLCFILLHENDGVRLLYFSGLLVSFLIALGIFIYLQRKDLTDRAFILLKWLLFVLLTVQFLIFPVNYGIIIGSNKKMPHVVLHDLEEKNRKGKMSWLVWEGHKSITFLIMDKSNVNKKRSLITLSRDKVKKIEILGYDSLLQVLFHREKNTSHDR